MPLLLERFQISVVGIWAPLGFSSQAQSVFLGPWAGSSEKTRVPVRPLGAAAAPGGGVFLAVPQGSWDFSTAQP